jgi:hypothetical protein
MVKGGGGGLFILIFVSKEGHIAVLERGLKERGLNIEITVPPFLSSQTCCRRGDCRG